jgi:hypothetical protein
MALHKTVPSTRSYPRLREMLSYPLRDGSSEQIETLFDNSEVSAQETEEFLSDLGRAFSSAARDVGRALPQVAKVALPIAQAALPIVGTAIGGPAGTILGGLAGQALGGLAGQGSSKPQGLPVQSPRMPVPSGAAAQLMQLLGDPRVLQSLGSIALGQAGSRTVSAGGTRISPAAIANLLGVLANQASAEAMALETYSLDNSGYTESMGDPAIAESRAAALLDLLQDTYPFEQQWESEPSDSYDLDDSLVEADWNSPESYANYYDSFFNTSEFVDYDPESSNWEVSDYGSTEMYSPSA